MGVGFTPSSCFWFGVSLLAVCPFAVKKLIPPGSNDPAITPRVAVLHVDAGDNPSLYEYFRDRSGGIESHFHITKTGLIEQYRDTGFQADANHKANDFAVSIETQGYGTGVWTKAQLESIKRLLLWLNQTHGIPLRKADSWDGSGVGYHVQFGAPGPWTPVAKSCPGPGRINQFNTILVPWMNTVTSGVKPVDQIRVVTANVYVGNKEPAKELDLLLSLDPDVIGLQEAIKWWGRLRKVSGYNVYGNGANGPAPAEVPILAKKNLKYRGDGIEKMSKKTGRPAAPDRWTTWLLANTEVGKVAFVNTHMNAAVQAADGTIRLKSPNARQYVKHMRRLRRLIKHFQKSGYRVVVTGDWNYRPKGVVLQGATWLWSPFRVFKKLGLTYTHVGLDGVAFDKGLKMLSRRVVKPVASDHRFLMVDLGRVK